MFEEIIMKQNKCKEIVNVHTHLPNKKNQVIRIDKCTQMTMDVKYITLLTDGNIIGKVRVGGSYSKVRYDEHHANWRLL